MAKAVSVDGDDEEERTRAKLDSMANAKCSQVQASRTRSANKSTKQAQRSARPSADHLLRNTNKR
jgi:hypothetical protein